MSRCTFQAKMNREYRPSPSRGSSSPAHYTEVGGIGGPQLVGPCGLVLVLFARCQLYSIRFTRPSRLRIR